jgi:hypothetical protein
MRIDMWIKLFIVAVWRGKKASGRYLMHEVCLCKVNARKVVVWRETTKGRVFALRFHGLGSVFPNGDNCWHVSFLTGITFVDIIEARDQYSESPALWLTLSKTESTMKIDHNA